MKEPRIEKITIEKIDRFSYVTKHDPYMIRYSVHLDNGEVHTAVTTLKPTVSEADAILNKLLKTCIRGSVNERK